MFPISDTPEQILDEDVPQLSDGPPVILPLVGTGATVIFQDRLPQDVPGLAELDQRRAALHACLSRVSFPGAADGPVQRARIGSGQILVGDLDAALAAAGVSRESLVDDSGLLFIRRATEWGRDYFLANHSGRPLDRWVALTAPADAVALLDPMSGRTGLGACRPGEGGGIQVYLQLQPGESVIVRTLPKSVSGPAWSLAWQAPVGLDYVSYDARFRVLDKAGNSSSASRAMVVDNVAPHRVTPVEFSFPEGTHLDVPVPHQLPRRLPARPARAAGSHAARLVAAPGGGRAPLLLPAAPAGERGGRAARPRVRAAGAPDRAERAASEPRAGAPDLRAARGDAVRGHGAPPGPGLRAAAAGDPAGPRGRGARAPEGPHLLADSG